MKSQGRILAFLAWALVLVASCNKGKSGAGVSTGAEDGNPAAAPAIMNPKSLVAALPADRLPKPGADGKLERDGASEWLQQKVASKPLEIKLRVHDIEIEDADEAGQYNVNLVVYDPLRGDGWSMNDGVWLDEIEVGGASCRIELWGEYPVWSNVSREQAAKLRDLKGKEIAFQCTVGELDFQEGDDDTRLKLVIAASKMNSFPAPPPPPPPPPPSATTLEGLLARLPKDKQPQPGPDALPERNEANAWLAENAVGRKVEFDLSVVDLELTDDSAGAYNIELIVLTDPATDETRRLGEGIAMEKTTIGRTPCQIQLWGYQPVWQSLDSAKAKQRRDVKGKRMRFQAVVEAAEFAEGEDDDQLALDVTVTDVVPLRAVEAPRPKRGRVEVAESIDDPVDPKPQDFNDELVQSIVPPAPKPIHARDLPPPQFGADVAEEFLEEDAVFPRRKVKVARVNGKLHGELRAYGPQRRLIYIERYKHGVQVGQQMWFYPTGAQLLGTTFVNGKQHGRRNFWFENGVLGATSGWKEGVLHGPVAVYFDNGNPLMELEYVDGVAEGVRRHGAPDGQVIGLTRWENGVEVHKVVFSEELENDRRVIAAINARNGLSQSPKDYWQPSQIAVVRANAPPPPDPNKKVGQWVPLFNGKNLDGWWPNKDPKKLTTWEVRDGVLIGRGQRAHMGYLYRDEDDYEDFHLRAEVRINAGGNSGLMLRSGPENAFDGLWPKGVEVQIANEHSFGVTGALFLSGSGPKNTNPLHHAPGDWFTLEAVIRGGRIGVKVNGELTANVAYPHSSTAHPPQGFIGLQLNAGHATTVEFRKIEVMRLAK
jgi:hypothetical protein